VAGSLLRGQQFPELLDLGRHQTADICKASLATAARSAALSLAMIGSGVPLGANRPFQPC
jgi:hypothetical protein